MLIKGMLYIEIDDEITDVFSKISSSKEEVLYLVIPTRSMLLTSLVNLKLIKKRADEEKKTVILVTHDKVGRTLASQAGLTAIKDQKEIEEFAEGAGQESIMPAQSHIPTSEDTAKKKKIPFSSTAFFEKLLYLLGFYKYDEDTARYKMVFTKPSKKAYVTILLFSILVLFATIIFGLPYAKIEIVPKMETKPVETNITFVAGVTSLPSKQVHRDQIEVVYDKVFKQAASGGTFKGEHAKGMVKVYNKSTKPWPIVPNSRLQTADGLVFLTQRFVSVPAATGSTPGELEVEVTAREKDANNQFIGDRGNIGPTKFSFPGLSSTNQQLIYAESISSMSGGKTIVERFITKEDIDAANKNIVQELKNLAPEFLQKQLENTVTDHTQYTIFQIHDDRFVSKEIIGIEMPRDLVGKKVDSFDMVGKMRSRAFYFKKTDVENILSEYFINHKLTAKERLLRMDISTLKFGDILAKDDTQVKVTASMNGLYTYSFEKERDALIKNIQTHITGLKKEEAEKYIQNIGSVEKVSISLSPVWQKTIPAIKESIAIELVEPK